MRVELVNMPWTGVNAPSIQCGLLKAECLQAGHECGVSYLNVEFAAFLGRERYQTLMDLRDSHAPKLIGEWLFGYAAFGRRGDEDEYLDLIADVLESSALTRQEVLQLREEVIPGWVDEVARREVWGQADVVGFSSTFEQNVAALALARRIKAAHPRVVTVFGGANFDGGMGPEYLRAFGWVDYAVIGEGDVAFQQLLDALSDGREPAKVAGVCFRRGGEVQVVPQAGSLVRVNSTPAPDYRDYFELLDRVGKRAVLGGDGAYLLYESARGCWWGEKHHCTFCGLNHSSMRFRSKDPVKVRAEVTGLADAHRVLSVQMVDNIMDMGYIDTLLPELAAGRHDLRIFYEIKANQRRDQIAAFARAGIVGVQPGIESLSDKVLKIMRKGSTVLTNVNLLKWCAFYGIRVNWNILLGFPGESADDYRLQAGLVPLLTHLEPPGSCENIWLERFSPYYYDESIAFRRRRPASGYGFTYPATLDIEKTAYFFEYDTDDAIADADRSALKKAVNGWKSSWRERRPRLDYERGSDWIRILDSRGHVRQEAVLEGWRAAAFEFCVDRPHSVPAILRRLADGPWGSVPAVSVTRFLTRCVDQGIALRSGSLYLSLALPLSDEGHAPAAQARESAHAL
jgi:ribosomal peptide maturation radical SAM protein 1